MSGRKTPVLRRRRERHLSKRYLERGLIREPQKRVGHHAISKADEVVTPPGAVTCAPEPPPILPLRVPLADYLRESP